MRDELICVAECCHCLAAACLRAAAPADAADAADADGYGLAFPVLLLMLQLLFTLLLLAKILFVRFVCTFVDVVFDVCVIAVDAAGAVFN